MRRVAKPGLPLTSYAEQGAFKLYMLVVGLLASHAGVPGSALVHRAEAEIDFLVQRGTDIAPIVVKAAENLQAKSLRSYRDKFAPSRCYRISLSSWREEAWLSNIPLYATARMGGVKYAAGHQQHTADEKPPVLNHRVGEIGPS